MHIRGEFLNYLEPPTNTNNNNEVEGVVVVENQKSTIISCFYSQLREILVERNTLISLDDADNQIVDQIVEHTPNSSSSSTAEGDETTTPSDISISSDFPSSLIDLDDIHITDDNIINVGKKKEVGQQKAQGGINNNLTNDMENTTHDYSNENDEDESSSRKKDSEDESDDDDDNKKVEEEEEVMEVVQGGGSISPTPQSFSTTTSNHTTTITTIPETCYYDVVQFPEDSIVRSRTVGVSENNKKYFYNVLR